MRAAVGRGSHLTLEAGVQGPWPPWHSPEAHLEHSRGRGAEMQGSLCSAVAAHTGHLVSLPGPESPGAADSLCGPPQVPTEQQV